MEAISIKKMHGKSRGFTLIEVVIAIAILVIIIASTMSLLASSYSSLRDSEMRAIAKNVATYTMEYIRSRNVTTDNNFINTSDWYDKDNNPNGKFPGLVDLWNIPLRPHNNNTSASINTNPATPTQTYQDEPSAFYYSLQGYASLGDFTNLSPTQPNPCQEDPNLEICPYYTTVNGVKEHHYHTMIGYNHIIMKFPFITTSSNAIKSFTALAGYKPMVYTADENKTNPNSTVYNPFYTNDSSLKNKTLAYRGFRVLIAIAARTKNASVTHVQYYDVKVTVFWRAGKQEHSYTLSSQIVTYGGS
jgi:prepilin-type N-terminal cleavage/methylation domain-containing protein